MLIAGSTQARLKVQLKLTGIVVTHDIHLAERLDDHALFLDHSKILFYAPRGKGAIPRASRPGICERRSAGVYFSDEKEETMAVGKEQQAGEVKVPRSKRRGD
jgi:ABC-type transporter Mla maintaining outer membrane lipid asymmetry ATPase subunit MlaF